MSPLPIAGHREPTFSIFDDRLDDLSARASTTLADLASRADMAEPYWGWQAHSHPATER